VADVSPPSAITCDRPRSLLTPDQTAAWQRRQFHAGQPGGPAWPLVSC